MKNSAGTLILAVLRIAMGWIFLWGFLDKLLGLGFATTPDKTWLSGSSPTAGFLKLATYGPFKPFFESLSANLLVDWLFMLGLLLLGISLILGIGMRIAAYSGSLLMILMWLSMFPPKNNPLLDDHIIYALVLLLLDQFKAGDTLGFGKSWQSTNLVKQYKFLK